MRVLVTGAAGFIGGAVTRALRAAGHDVAGLDCLHSAAHKVRPERPDADLIVGDVRDAATVRAALSGADVVCHHAAMVGMGVNMSDAPEYVSCNDYGTAVLLAEMASAGVNRLVLASSMVVYGEGGYRCAEHGSQRPCARREADLRAGRFEPTCPSCGQPLEWACVAEDAPLEPRSVYAASKLAQEHLSSAWARATGGAVIALRYHNVYGPHMPRDTPYAGVAAIFRSAVARGEAPRVFEDGRQLRDFVHVSDVAAANLRAVSRADLDWGGLTPYNIASGEPHTIGDLAAAVTTAANGPAPDVTGAFRAGDVRHVVASPERARRELDFTAQMSFSAGMASFVTDPLR